MTYPNKKTEIRIRRLRQLVDSHGGTAQFVRDLAKPGVDKPPTESYINQLLGGHKTSFGEKSATNIAALAGLPENYFDQPDDAGGRDELDLSPVKLRMVPFLSSWVRAGEFTQSPSQYSLAEGEELLPSPFYCGKRTYAVTVRGDSMADPTGYFPGDIVFIDPDAGYAPGDDVVAMDKEGRLSLKRYKEHETGEPYLLQLNGNKIIDIDGEWHVCGRVIFSARKR